LWLEKVLAISLTSLLLASLLTLTFPTKFDVREAENLVRMKMIVVAARYVSVILAQEYTDYMLEAGLAYDMNPALPMALNITESELNHRAKSPLGYKGISQIPVSLPIWQNIMKGAEIPREKLRETHSIERAIGDRKGFGFISNAHTRKLMRLKREIELAAAFGPVVESAMNEAGITRQYKELVAGAQAIPFFRLDSFDLDQYVVAKALDGLLRVVADEERKIRTNPAARTTDLLREVFAKR
jgi:hypothetical protein